MVVKFWSLHQRQRNERIRELNLRSIQFDRNEPVFLNIGRELEALYRSMLKSLSRLMLKSPYPQPIRTLPVEGNWCRMWDMSRLASKGSGPYTIVAADTPVIYALKSKSAKVIRMIHMNCQVREEQVKELVRLAA